MDVLLFVARLLLSTVFVVSAAGKLAEPKGTRQALSDFGLARGVTGPVSIALPTAELVVALALVLPEWVSWGALFALALLLLMTAVVTINLMRGRRPVCHCFGQLDSRPIGWHTLARNGVLAGIAGFILSQAGVTSHLEEGGILQTMSVHVQIAIFALIALVLAGQGWFIYLLLRRLASLEKRLATIGFWKPAGSGRLDAGLQVGARAPNFGLPDVGGKIVTLSDLRDAGKPILLVFTDVECAPCTQLLPTLARWQRDHAAHFTIANVSRGSPAATRVKSTNHPISNVLVTTGDDIVHAYGAVVIPSAVLIRPDGTIGSALALGEGEIGDLIQKTLHESCDKPPTERVSWQRVEG